MWRPPFTSTCAPWTNSDASDASQTTTAATSSGVPARPSGVFPMVRSRTSAGQAAIIGVSMIPGLTQLTRIPWCPANRATDFVSADHARLGGGVRRTRGEPSDLAGERRDRHDPPAAARNHRPKRRLAGEERAAEVHRLDPVPLVGRDLIERRRVEDARAGDEDIDRPELRLGDLDDPSDVVGVGDVHAGGGRTLTKLDGRHARRCLVEVGDEDVRSLGGEPGAAGPTDATRRAGHESRLACELGVHRYAASPGHGRTSCTSSTALPSGSST